MDTSRLRGAMMSGEEAQSWAPVMGTRLRTASHPAAETMATVNKDWQLRLSTVSSPRSSLSVSDVHSWTHMGATASDVRPSRASSVISTHTKTSITTVHDEVRESLDVHIGREAVYRMNMDGSMRFISQVKAQQADQPAISPRETDGNQMRPTSDTDTGTQPPPTAAAGEVSAADSVARNLSFKPGAEKLAVQGRRSSSHSTPTRNEPTRPPSAEDTRRLRRRGGLRIKPVTGNSSGQGIRGASPLSGDSGTSYQTAGSQPSALSARADDTGSPAYIGTNAPGFFPPAEDFSKKYAVEWAEADDRDAPLGDRLLKLHGLPATAVFRGASGRSDGDHQGHSFPGLGRFDFESRTSQDERSVSLTADVTPPPLIVTEGPLPADDSPHDAAPPSPTDTQNGISAHYSRLVRIIDSSYQDNIQAKDQELSEARDMLEGLARQALDLKAELIRTKSQVAAMSDPVHIRKLAREQTIEAQSFSFPPLKLNHVRTLKMALKRRAEKMKKGLDDDLGWLIRMPPSPALDEPTNGAAVDPPPAEALDPARTPDRGDVQMRTTSANDVAHDSSTSNDADMAQSLLWARRRLRDAEMEQNILQAQVINLRATVDLWKARYQKLERGRTSSISTTTTTTTTAAAAPAKPDLVLAEVARATREVDDLWQARWHSRNEQLQQRMWRIEEDARKAFQEAVKEKDRRLVELEERCARLAAALKLKEDDVKGVRGGWWNP